MGCGFSFKSYWVISFNIAKINPVDRIYFIRSETIAEAIKITNYNLIDYLIDCTIYKKQNFINNYNETLIIDIAICRSITNQDRIAFIIEHKKLSRTCHISPTFIQDILCKKYINTTNISKFIDNSNVKDICLRGMNIIYNEYKFYCKFKSLYKKNFIKKILPKKDYIGINSLLYVLGCNKIYDNENERDIYKDKPNKIIVLYNKNKSIRPYLLNTLTELNIDYKIMSFDDIMKENINPSIKIEDNPFYELYKLSSSSLLYGDYSTYL